MTTTQRPILIALTPGLGFKLRGSTMAKIQMRSKAVPKICRNNKDFFFYNRYTHFLTLTTENKKCVSMKSVSEDRWQVVYLAVNSMPHLFLLCGLVRFLAHLSRRLKGELIVYQSSCRLCVCVCVCVYVCQCVHTFKHEYL